MDLKAIGWNEHFEEQYKVYLDTDLIVARVVSEFTRMYRLYSIHGELIGEVTGKLRHQAVSREDFPAVGDWVVIQPFVDEGKAIIHGVLPRISKFSRKVAGDTTEEQIIATNIDTVFIVVALNNDFNIRRIERYLIMAWESGAHPVIVLSKADLSEDVDAQLREVESVALGVPIHIISSIEKKGLDELNEYLGEGKTVALLGSSGVGKSTLINALYGKDVQMVKDIRAKDDKGKHTTTNRELILLPNGGIIMDTPGMREFQLWESGNSVSDTFQDIEQLAEKCFFRDCKHENEPNCAVLEAIDTGEIDTNRLKSYKKMKKEIAYLERKEEQKAKLNEKLNKKKLTKR